MFRPVTSLSVLLAQQGPNFTQHFKHQRKIVYNFQVVEDRKLAWLFDALIDNVFSKAIIHMMLKYDVKCDCEKLINGSRGLQTNRAY